MDGFDLHESLAGLAAALDQVDDATVAAGVVCDHLVAAGPYMPSLYLERGGRLRCMAVRGYGQVLDGFPLGVGIIGHTFEQEVPTVVREISASTHFLEAVPGVQEEICVPISVAGVVVGVVNVEGRTALPAQAEALLEGAAELYAQHLERHAGRPQESPAQRLARHAVVLAGLRDAHDIEARLLWAAVDITGMASALLVLDATAGGRRRAVGPLAPQLEQIDDEGVATISSWVDAGTSCYTLGRVEGLGFGGHDFFLRAGAGTVVVVQLQARGEHLGFLAVADVEPAPPHTDAVERLELLATLASASLTTADAVLRLTAAALLDPLTGLRHSRTFRTDLADRRAVLGSEGRLAVLLIDIDHFKLVNDRFGHLEGDRLLVALGGAFSAVLSGGGTVYRVGGDELAALAEVDSPKDALLLADELCAVAAATRAVTVSIGIAIADADATTEPHDDLLARADRALYESKAAGRNRAHLSDGAPPTVIVSDLQEET